MGGYNPHNHVGDTSMFGIGFWELIIIGVVGLLFCVGPIVAVVVVLGMSAASRNRASDERGP